MRDENYITLAPRNLCVNRYCPSGPIQHDVLVRGYCEPCASIRVPNSDYVPALGLGRTTGTRSACWTSFCD